MTWGAVAVAGATLVAGYMSSRAQKKAGEQAASAQERAAQIGTEEQRRQFDRMQQLLLPYTQAGVQSLEQQKALLGLPSSISAGEVIKGIQQGPEYISMLKQGETSILQNAAATGGLRGGNTEAALAQFSPNLLAKLIQERFQNLGGIASVGQNAAAMTGNAGMQTAENVANLQQQMGAAQAGLALSTGKSQSQMWNTIPQAVGAYYGYKQGKF